MLGLYIAGCVIVLLGISVFFGAPYVPSHRKDVRRLFDALALSDNDVVLDIGSGDGVILREASRRGARAIGYEIHPLFVAVAGLLSLGDARVRVRWANAWTAQFPADVTLVYLFGVGRDEKRIIKKLQKEADRLGRSLRVVCYGNPLTGQTLTQTIGAYAVYQFAPLHQR